MCLLVAAPLLMLFRSWLVLDAELWQHLWDTQLIELIGNTLLLLFGVGIGVAVLGIPLAWLTANCEFPGRKFFDWALILPLAIPAYVLAFVTLGIYDFGGVIQSGIRALGYQGFFDARHPIMVIWVMTAVLYPYVYLLVRAAFISQGTHMLNVARTLGQSPWRAFFEVVLPAARPAIVAGMALALMEALADFGAVSIFGFNTFTTAIYKSWLSLFSLHTAAQLSTLLLLFVLLCLFSERKNRRGLKQQARTQAQNHDRFVLQGAQKNLATAFCSLVFVLTVVAPVIQLLSWALPQMSGFLSTDFLFLVARTFSLGLISALTVVFLSLLIAASQSGGKAVSAFTEFAGLGYALPGSVLAIGIMLALGGLDAIYVSLSGAEPILLGSLFGLLAAYVIRFFRPGFGAVQTGFSSIHRNHLESAALLGVSGWQRFFRVSVPMVLPGMLTGGLLVFVDVIKEMPASLLLRPFGWDTLAIKLYELTSEGEWQLAAVPALALVLVSLLPVIMLIRRSRSFQNTDTSVGLPAA